MHRLAAIAASFFLLPGGAGADGVDVGAYLAGRIAAHENDYAASETYFERVLARDPGNAAAHEIRLAAEIAQGDMIETVRAADALIAAGQSSQSAHLARLIAHLKSESWDEIEADFAAGRGVSPLVDDFTRAWIDQARGQTDAARAKLAEIAQDEGLRNLAQSHDAFMLALSGAPEEAAEILSGLLQDPLRMSRPEAISFAQILSQADRHEEARALIDARFPGSPDEEIRALRRALEAGAVLEQTELHRPDKAIHQILLLIFANLGGQDEHGAALIYGRFAQMLAPGDTTIDLALAQIFGALDRPDLGAEIAAALRDDPDLGPAAMLTEADLLSEAGDLEGAIEVLRARSQIAPPDPNVPLNLGEALRQSGRFDEAVLAYDDAIEQIPAGSPVLGHVYFVRAMAHHGREDAAATEADLRSALALLPENPGILNYLGYSLLEWGGDLDEALDMINRAVAAEPENGAIVDSLGWAYFRLGRYEEAVAPLQRATVLEPTDPIVSDHFGDALWAVGRADEARFQWRRALSFGPEEKERLRIRRKLELGLDALLLEEGAAPTRAAE